MEKRTLKHSICQLNKSDPHHAYNWRRSNKKLSEDILTNVWGPYCLKSHNRRNENWLFSDWCTLDFDDGQISLSEAVEEFCHYQHIIVTTRSHQKEKNGKCCDRFRVVIPWDERIERSEVYAANMAPLVETYATDPCGKIPSQKYYPGKEIISINRNRHADRMEVRYDLPLDKYKREEEPWDGEPQLLTPWALKVLADRRIFEGQRDLTTFRLAKDLIKTGMSDDDILAEFKKITYCPQIKDDEFFDLKIAAAHKHLTREVERGEKKEG